MEYTTRKELHSWRLSRFLGNPGIRKISKMFFQAVFDAEEFIAGKGMSLNPASNYAKIRVGKPNGREEEGRIHRASVTELEARLSEILKGREDIVWNVSIPVSICDGKGEAFATGSVYYTRSMGPNSFEYGDPLHRGRENAGIYIEMNVELEKVGDKARLDELLS